jgi:hypothetical protein
MMGHSGSLTYWLPAGVLAAAAVTDGFGEREQLLR